MALTEFTKGTIINPDEVNSNFSANKILEIYAGTGFDSSASSGTDEQSYEANVITSLELGSADYVSISINATHVVLSDSTTYFKIQSKEVGGSFSDSLPETLIDKMDPGTLSNFNYRTKVFTWIHTLTTGEKSNGVQFKIFSKSVGGSSVTASVTNIQTVIKTSG